MKSISIFDQLAAARELLDHVKDNAELTGHDCDILDVLRSRILALTNVLDPIRSLLHQLAIEFNDLCYARLSTDPWMRTTADHLLDLGVIEKNPEKPGFLRIIPRS